MTSHGAHTVDGPEAPESDASGRTPPPKKVRLTIWVRAHPGMAVALVLPLVVFGVPQLFGGTFLTGDNMIQNLPMRALVGWDLDHGIAPLWNPYLFSGTPLLGGFNAGAAYPLTWLTAVLPLFTAWTLTLVVAYDTALAGMYLFLRRQGMATTAATFGAVTFAFAGYMSAQMVHIDLIEGAAWLPWMLVSVHALTGGRTPARRRIEGQDEGRVVRRRRRRWVVVLALSIGLALLAGNAEAVIDSVVLLAVYTIGRLVSSGLLHREARRALTRSSAALVCGVVGGIAVGAVQWLPGLVFLSQSQRAVNSYSYFASGSLNPRLLALVPSPFLLGTNQPVPGPYIGAYNYQEVTSYAGILALIAACSLLLRRWRTRPEARQWWVWYVVLAVGLLSALGANSPFGRLMYLVPGINSERLLNRNLLLVDFALAVLLAWWLDGLLASRAGRPVAPTTVRSRWTRGGRSEVIVTCIPLVVIAVLCALLWVDGPLLGRLLEVLIPWSTSEQVRVAVLVSVQLGVAAWATWVVLVEQRFSTRKLTALLTAVLTVDLVLFNCFVVAPPTSESQAQAEGPASATFGSLVGDGRFLVYDPDRLYGQQLLEIGQTDLNIYRRLPSGQGYSALTGGGYYAATGSHYQEDLDPGSLAGTVWDGLNVTTLLSVPGYFVTPAPGGSRPGVTPSIQLPTDLSAYRYSPAPLHLSAGSSRRWYFGGLLTVRSWDVPLLAGGAGRLRAGLVTPHGGLTWLPAADTAVVGTGSARRLRVDLPSPVAAGGLVVAPSSSAAVLGTPEADTVEGGEVSLDGRMQSGVTFPHWEFSGMLGPFGVFRNSRPQGWAALRAPGGGPTPAGSSVTAVAPGEGGGATITVRAGSAAVLVRSAAWADGWQATVQPITGAGGHRAAGPATGVPVEPDGVLQAVRIPSAGDYRVTFRYRPWPVTVGAVVSGGAVAVLAAVGLAELFAARRRRLGQDRGLRQG